MSNLLQDAATTRKQFLKLAMRIGFLQGIIYTIDLYAVWKDGERFVGVMREPLHEALKPYQMELEKLLLELEQVGTLPAI